MMLIYRAIISVLIILTLTNCAGLNLDKSTVKFEGTRINPLYLESELVIDHQLASLEMKLPQQSAVNNWISSGGGQYLLPSNIKSLEPKNYNKKNIKNTKNSLISNNVVSSTTMPIIVNGKIFILYANQLIAFNEHDLKQLWSANLMMKNEKQSAKAYIGGGLNYHNGRLYVTLGSKDLMVVDTKDGHIIWHKELTNISRSTPIAHNDKLFVLTIDNKLYVLNLSDGKTLWFKEGVIPNEDVAIFGSSSLNIAQDTLLVPHSSGQLQAIDINNGEDKWIVNLSYDKIIGLDYSISDIDITPVVQNDIVYAASSTGNLLAINLHTGRMQWQSKIKNIKNIWVANDFTYVLTFDNSILAVYNKTGKVKWSKNLYNIAENKSQENSFNGPVMANDLLYLTSSSGKLIALSPYNGEVLKEYKIEKQTSLLPIITTNSIILFNDRGVISRWY